MIANLVFQKPELFDELVQIYFKNEEPVSMRAAWIVDTITEELPKLLLPWLETICRKLPQFGHDGLKRHSLRMLVRSPLPPAQIGPLTNICFKWLISPKESVAVKVYTMEILYRISQTEPDLKKELADSIEWRMEEETPGFRNRGLKILKKLHKEINVTH